MLVTKVGLFSFKHRLVMVGPLPRDLRVVPARRLLRHVPALLSAGLIAVEISRPLILTEIFPTFS